MLDLQKPVYLFANNINFILNMNSCLNKFLPVKQHKARPNSNLKPESWEAIQCEWLGEKTESLKEILFWK